MLCCKDAPFPLRAAPPELGLDQLLADPLIRLVMASDGVSEATIRGLRRPRAAAAARPN